MDDEIQIFGEHVTMDKWRVHCKTRALHAFSGEKTFPGKIPVFKEDYLIKLLYGHQIKNFLIK
jgi:hypothetical protein